MNLCQVFQGLLMVKAMHVRDSAWQGLHHVICHPSVGKTILPATWGAKRGSIHQAKGAVYITNTPRALPFALPHRLWYHELSRVFCDRLISKADKDRHAIPTYPIWSNYIIATLPFFRKSKVRFHRFPYFPIHLRPGRHHLPAGVVLQGCRWAAQVQAGLTKQLALFLGSDTLKPSLNIQKANSCPLTRYLQTSWSSQHFQNSTCGSGSQCNPNWISMAEKGRCYSDCLAVPPIVLRLATERFTTPKPRHATYKNILHR